MEDGMSAQLALISNSLYYTNSLLFKNQFFYFSICTSVEEANMSSPITSSLMSYSSILYKFSVHVLKINDNFSHEPEKNKGYCN